MKLFQTFVKSAAKPTTSPRVVGIDIGSSAIKVVELQDRDGIVTLMTYGELQLGPYMEKAVGQAVMLTPPMERQALVDILRESAVKAKDAVLAIPLSASFVTVMPLLANADEDIAPRVRVEARKYIPVPIVDVTLDWAEIFVKETEVNTARNVLLAAIQNDALKRLADLMTAVDFSQAPTEIECFSAIRASYNTDQEVTAVMDIGATTSKLYIIRQGVLQQMYRLPSGGQQITDKIVADFQCSFEEAEAKKRSVTVSDVDYVQLLTIHQNVIGRTLKEFRHVIEQAEQRLGSAVSDVVLAGGVTLFPGIDTFIGHDLSRPVRYSTPFEKVAYPAFMEDTLRLIGPTFAPALGAALRLYE